MTERSRYAKVQQLDGTFLRSIRRCLPQPEGRSDRNRCDRIDLRGHAEVIGCHDLSDRSATFVDPVTRDKARQDYAIDLQKAFACLDRLGAWGNEPMPAHPVPITGVHFGIGQDDAFYRDGVATGQRSANAIWIAVDSVRLE